MHAEPLYRTVVETPMGRCVVTTQDFAAPGYRLTGYESFIDLEDEDGDGLAWHIGPEHEGHSPLRLHMEAIKEGLQSLMDGDLRVGKE